VLGQLRRAHGSERQKQRGKLKVEEGSGIAKSVLLFFISLAVISSSIYAAVIPLWNVPDEPRHFDYVRALWLEWQNKKADPEVVQSEILESMDRSQWYQLNHIPRPEKEPVVLDDIPFLRLSLPARISQPPLYYALAAGIIGFSGQTAIDSQVYVARAFSVLLGVMAVVSGLVAAKTLFPRDNTLVMVTGGLIALWPQRLFISAGVSNDNLAILASSLEFMFLVLIMRHGFSMRRLLGLLLGLAMVLLSKATALVIIPAMVVVMVAAIVRMIAHKWSAFAAVVLLISIGVFLIVSAASSIEQCDVFDWTSNNSTVCTAGSAKSPAGLHGIRVENGSPDHPRSAGQYLPMEDVIQLRGRQVTFGSWARSSTASNHVDTYVFDGQIWHANSFLAGPDWSFHAETFSIAENTRFIEIVLKGDNRADSSPGLVSFSGIVVVEGDCTHAGVPTYAEGGDRVVWGGRELKNHVHNSSGERAIYRLKYPLSQLAARLRIENGFRIAQSFFNPDSAGKPDFQSYIHYTSVLISSFFAWFGWMNVKLPELGYQIAGVVSLLAFAGMLWFLVKNSTRIVRRESMGTVMCVWLSLFIIVTGFVVAFFRESPTVGLSQGRYALPVIVPFAVLVGVGIRELCPASIWRFVGYGTIALMVILNIAIIGWVLMPFYHGA